MASGFGPEGPGSISDTKEDPPSAYGVLTLKIRGSESPLIGPQQFTTGIVTGKNFSPFKRHIKIEGKEMDAVVIYRRKAGIGL